MKFRYPITEEAVTKYTENFRPMPKEVPELEVEETERMKWHNVLKIDVAEPDDDWAPVDWRVEAAVLFTLGAFTMALIMLVLWGADIFAALP
jgi:hypothetical protein